MQNELDGGHLDHLPLIRHLMDRLGIPQIFRERLPPHPLARVSDADCAIVFILNILSHKVALYRMNDWIEHFDTALVLGEGCPKDAFDDARMAACLDHVDEIGTDLFLSDVARHHLHALKTPQVSFHLDTTSLVLYGIYEDALSGDPLPTYGFSKDHRPDLKQLVFGMVIESERKIPVAASTLDGNTHDSVANRGLLEKVAMLLPDQAEATFIGDCKLVDATTLGQLKAAGFHFISLLPSTYALRQELITEAWKEPLEKWAELANKPAERRGEAPTLYHGRSFSRPFRINHKNAEGKVSSEWEEHRFVVVHSGWQAKLFDQHLPEKKKKEQEALQAQQRWLDRHPFGCQKDAEEEAKKGIEKFQLHKVSIEILEVTQRQKRKGKGRPKKGEETEMETFWKWKISWEERCELEEKRRQEDSCFVLITDHLIKEKEWSDQRILSEYRHQASVEGHTGFRWLKGPAGATPVFLKTPGRIRAMGLMFMLALMVRNYIQFTMREEAQAIGERLTHPFTKKPEPRLTTEKAMEHFAGVLGQVLRQGTQQERLRPKLREAAKVVLRCLKIPESIYWETQRWEIQGPGP